MISREERKERWRRCAEYIREAGNLPDAQALARMRDHYRQNTSVWITALSKLIESGWRGREKESR